MHNPYKQNIFFPTTKCSKSALELNSFMDTHGILNELSKPTESSSQDRGQAVICHYKVLYSELIFTLQPLSGSQLSIPIKTKVLINEMRVPVRIFIYQEPNSSQFLYFGYWNFTTIYQEKFVLKFLLLIMLSVLIHQAIQYQSPWLFL